MTENDVLPELRKVWHQVAHLFDQGLGPPPVELAAEWLIKWFKEKEGVLDCNTRLEVHPDSEATLTYEGTTYHFNVQGFCRLVGDKQDQGGKIFAKFCRHPFWQYGHMSRHVTD
jgi:hypothetical protein